MAHPQRRARPGWLGLLRMLAPGATLRIPIRKFRRSAFWAMSGKGLSVVLECGSQDWESPQFCYLPASAWTRLVYSDGAGLGRSLQSWCPFPN